MKISISKGRRRIYLGRNHPYADTHGWCWYARFLMQLFLGRKLLKTEHVHHKNRDKTDDQLENLEVLDCHYHGSVHASGVLVADVRGELEEPVGPFDIARSGPLLGPCAKEEIG